MKFKSIFFANLAEIALPLARLMQKKKAEEEIFEDHALCDRFLFSCQDNCILLTPFKIEKKFFHDSFRLLNLKNVMNLSPKKIKESLCKAVLNDSNLFEFISKVIRENPGIELRSYSATSGFIQLTEILKNKGYKFNLPEVPNRNSFWTTAFFDSKSGFRQLTKNFGSIFPKMPEGYICETKKEILGWANYFIKNKNGCVLKTNRGLAGAGLKIIKKSEIHGNIDDYVGYIIDTDDYWNKDLVIVEEYLVPDLSVAGGSPNIELMTDGKTLTPLYVCGMRITDKGVFLGVEMGKEAMPDFMKKTLSISGHIFGNALLHHGYKGYFEIDFIYGKGNKIVPIEANLRRTGGTHVYDLCKRLLGSDFLKKYYIVAANMLKMNKFETQSYLLIKDKLKDYLFPRNNKKEGVIITNTTYLEKGFLGYVVISGNKKRTLKIERNLINML